MEATKKDAMLHLVEPLVRRMEENDLCCGLQKLGI